MKTIIDKWRIETNNESKIWINDMAQSLRASMLSEDDIEKAMSHYLPTPDTSTLIIYCMDSNEQLRKLRLGDIAFNIVLKYNDSGLDVIVGSAMLTRIDRPTEADARVGTFHINSPIEVRLAQ